MPATPGGKKVRPFVLGVDGYRGGWVFVRINLSGQGLSAGIVRSFRDLLSGPAADAKMTLIDMPIGLASTGRRACEAEARKLLSPRRASSVFPSPRRTMLSFDDYAAANEWGKAQGAHAGGGLSKQAWMITPKIKEIDEAMTPEDQSRIGEGHPEIAFTRLNDGSPCYFSKRTPEGKAERYRLLKRHGLPAARRIYTELRLEHGAIIGEDDVYDACALALSARARLAGQAIHLTDGARDEKGLLMEIWG